MQRGRKRNRALDLWLGVPALNVLATLRRRRGAPGRYRKVGVICSPALGDTLLFSGALQDLRAHFQQGPDVVEIVHFCMKSNVAAAELIPGADRRVVVDLTAIAETVRVMRKERLDLLLDFTSWQRLTAFFTMASGARFTVGFETSGQHRSRGYDLSVRHRGDRHEVENFRAILAPLGISTGAAPKVVPPDCEACSAKGLELVAGVEDLVVLHLWASGQRSCLREWPEERWVELAGRLAQRETMFVVTGAAADLWRMEPFVRKMEEAGLRATAFVGNDGFRSLAGVLMRARVVVSVNTGVMHLAAIVGAPTVALNGPNRNGRWGPVGTRAIGVESPGEGCGYLHLGFEFDGQATDCMERITVERVVQAVEAVTRPDAATHLGVLRAGVPSGSVAMEGVLTG